MVLYECPKPTLLLSIVIIYTKDGIVWILVERWHELLVAADVAVVYEEFHAHVFHLAHELAGFAAVRGGAYFLFAEYEDWVHAIFDVVILALLH